jgi:mono/diheme cytochrome c family protein
MENRTGFGWGRCFLTRRAPRAMLPALLLAAVGCQQQMAAQPSFRPLKPSGFFPDGRSARPLVMGTVAREPDGVFYADTTFTTGRLPAREVSNQAPPPEAYGNILPFRFAELKEKTLRGQQRFNIYCAVCHGRDGDGKGMIPQRGFTEPPSFHTDLSRGFRLRGYQVPLREAPVGYLFEVITRGFGAMPDYREQIPVDDRWAIVAYVRTLQFSRHAGLADVTSEADRQRLEQKRGQPK